MAVPVDLPAVQGLIDQLQAVDLVRAASMDPADLQSTPCVWVQLRGIAQTHLAASTIRLNLYLIVGDSDGGMRAAAALVDLYNACLDVVTPDGETVSQGVVMPDGVTLPALLMPVDILNTPPE